MCGGDPCGYRIPRLLGDLELHWSLCFLLHDNRAAGDVTALDHIVDAQRDQITPAQFAVDGEIEQGEISGAMIQLQSNSDGPDSLSASAAASARGACPFSTVLHARRIFVSISRN